MIYIVVVLGLCFAYINGMHDGGAVVATAISSRVFTPRKAVLMAGTANFIGAVLLGEEVARTIFCDVISVTAVTEESQLICYEFVIAAFAGSMIWNMATWFLRLPSSASHSMIGAMIGAGISAYGYAAIEWLPVFLKVILAMVISPIAGFLAGLLLNDLFLRLLRNGTMVWNRRITLLHKLSNVFLALCYGSNDSQKVMGLISIGVLYGSSEAFHIPIWLLLATGGALALGTMTGGYNMIRTVGMNICRIDLRNSFTSQASVIFVMIVANVTGLPISATQVITSSVMGVGSSDTPRNVNWPVAKSILLSWGLTIPVSALVGYGVFTALSYVQLT